MFFKSHPKEYEIKICSLLSSGPSGKIKQSSPRNNEIAINIGGLKASGVPPSTKDPELILHSGSSPSPTFSQSGRDVRWSYDRFVGLTLSCFPSPPLSNPSQVPLILVLPPVFYSPSLLIRASHLNEPLQQLSYISRF